MRRELQGPGAHVPFVTNSVTSSRGSSVDGHAVARINSAGRIFEPGIATFTTPDTF